MSKGNASLSSGRGCTSSRFLAGWLQGIMGILLLTSRTQVINSQANYGLTASPCLRVDHDRDWLHQQHCLKKMHLHQDKDLGNEGANVFHHSEDDQLSE